ncbi:MAG: hydrogenase maturation nickel metallochaperone HypA [Anaerolineae bacterium]|nr:hydrogenase maturation nickel metallochaperone HypA [Anaerolineae bacterium]
MHELSLAESLIEQVERAVEAAGGGHVTALQLSIGALAGVDAAALRFGFDVAAQGTRLDGATLDITLLPVIIHCPSCDAGVELPDIQHFRCPRCGTPSLDVRQGRELTIETVEVLDETPSP